MTRGGSKHIHLVLMLGIFLFIPLFVAYSVYVDLSDTVLLSSDTSFEDSEDEDSLTYQNKSKIFMPAVPSNLILSATHFGSKSNLFLSPLTSHSQTAFVLRC